MKSLAPLSVTFSAFVAFVINNDVAQALTHSNSTAQS